jgi:hypothetical protein
MPRMNGTGPEGKGPGTGRRQGRCKNKPGNEDNTWSGRSKGPQRKSDRGQGRGRRLQAGNNR